MGDEVRAAARPAGDTFAFIGKALPNVDFERKVKGEEKYGLDLSLPGMLHAKAVGCPYPHARVKGIRVDKARASPGVNAVITAADIKPPGTNRYGDYAQDHHVLIPVGGKACMVGDPVALVVAVDEGAAALAAELVEVDYEVLEPVWDPERALDPDAPVIHEEYGENLCIARITPPQLNVLEGGDVEEGFSRAEVVVEGTYRTPRQEHAYMEPEGGVADIEPDGTITLFAGSQAPMQNRTHVSRALGIPEARIRLVNPSMGGAFGGRIDVSVQIHLALAVLHVRRPVRLAWSHEESFLRSPKRHPVVAKMKVGAKRDGTLTAIAADFLLDAGAYASASPAVLKVCLGYSLGPYHVPNYRVSGKAVYTNNPISGAFRGFGGPQAAFAIETSMNKLAAELGMDPLDLRRKNLLRDGMKAPWHYVTIDGPISMPRVLDRVEELMGPRPEPSGPDKRVGRGFSCTMPIFDVAGHGLYLCHGAGLFLELLPDASALVRCESAEYGEGIGTVLAIFTAEEFGIPVENVQWLRDMSASPKSGRAVASRQVYVFGNAVRKAAAAIKERVKKVVAEEMEVSADDLEFRDGNVQVRGAPNRKLSLADAAWLCRVKGVDLGEEVWYEATHANLGHTFMASAVDVEVDVRTGKFELLKSAIVHDVGRAINPPAVIGQLFGGEAQGIGMGGLEDLRTDGAQLSTPTLVEYLLPTAVDIPKEGIADYVEEPYPTGPYGAKGCAEHSVDDTPPAMVGAIHDAVGVWVDSLPVTSEKVWRATLS